MWSHSFIMNILKLPFEKLPYSRRRLGQAGLNTKFKKGKQKPGQIQTPQEVPEDNKKSSSSGWLDNSFEIMSR